MLSIKIKSSYYVKRRTNLNKIYYILLFSVSYNKY